MDIRRTVSPPSSASFAPGTNGAEIGQPCRSEIDQQTLSAAAAVCQISARTFVAEADPPFCRTLLSLAYVPTFAAVGLAPFSPQERALHPVDLMHLLSGEYRRLFAGDPPLCPLQAPADAHRATRDLRSDLPTIDRTSSDDNIGFVLALLGRLLSIAAGETPAEATPAQAHATARELRNGYLRPWTSRFLADVEAHSRVGPYRPMARMTALLLDNDCLF